MKTDDPRLEEARKKQSERLRKIDEMMLIVLKNHLTLEQFMDEFLDVSGQKYDDLSFSEKAELCKELDPEEIDAPMWDMLNGTNQLRNKIAHTLDQAQIQSKIDELRAVYLAALTQTQATAAAKLDDARMVASACELCGAYLVVATIGAQGRKKS